MIVRINKEEVFERISKRNSKRCFTNIVVKVRKVV